MYDYTIGTTAIAAGQRAIQLIGQNIANATTPGYHRQSVNLASTVDGAAHGTGVDIASITRYTAGPVHTAILTSNGSAGETSARLAVRQQIESSLGTGTGGISDQLTGFFNQVAQLTSQPDSTAARRTVLGTATGLAGQFNTTATNIDRLRSDVGAQIQQAGAQVNTLAAQIADYNVRITNSARAGNQPNDLIDQRDQLVNTLSGLIDIRTVDMPYGVVNVIASGAAVVVGEFANKFQITPNAAGKLDVTQTGVSQPVTIKSGTLGGLLQEYNTDIPATSARLDTLAGLLASKVNAVQATGIGLSGPLTSSNGSVSASSPTATLNTAGLPFAVTAGQLTVSVTNASGNRTNTAIAIDPTTDTLQSIATTLSAVPGLTASVNATTNTLQIQAQPGFSFDFAGRDTNPPGGGAVANTDTSGVLVALGVNGLFTGSTAAGLAVQPAIVANPNLLAASRTGQPGDATNLERFAALRDLSVISGRTLEADFADQAASVGNAVQTLGDQQTSQTGLLQTLNTQEQTTTGVDTNEELVNLLSYQRMVQGASKYLSIVNTAMDEIMNIIR